MANQQKLVAESLPQQTQQSQIATTVTLVPVPINVLPAGHDRVITVLPAQPAVVNEGNPVTRTGVGSVGAPPPPPQPTLAPPLNKQVPVLQTQAQTNSDQSNIFQSFRQHIETFLVEVYRCKLCKFHSAVKAVMVGHMTQKHAAAVIPGQDQGSTPAVQQSDQASGACLVPQTSGTVQTVMQIPAAVTTSVQRKLSTFTLSSQPSTTNLPTTGNEGRKNTDTSTSSVIAEHSEQVQATNNINKTNLASSSSSTVTNALELLMGIGNEKDPDVASKSKDGTAVAGPSSFERPDQSLPGNAGLVLPVSISKIPGSQTDGLPVVTTVQDLAAITSLVTTSQSQASELLTVNQEELAKTLKIDEKKGREGDARLGGAEVTENGDGTRDGLREEVSVLKPFPVQIGLGPSMPSIDIQEIANTASKSNPKATTITVLHHGQGNEPPTAIQFKKSKKSKAVIPTGESLGIASPFSNRTTYRGNKCFACTACHARYKSVAELDRHFKKKHQRDRKFLCEICGEALATRASVRYHVSKKHAAIKKVFSCSVCDYTTPFSSRMAIHQAKHQSNFFCNLCQRSYVSAERLRKHYSSPLHKNALNPLVCEHCGYSTKKRDNFLVHMRKHTGEKPYKCKLCDYASADGSTLKKHVMAKHSTIRPFKCPSCTFSCVDKKGLDIHVRKHTGERPFKCPFCLYAAKRRSALTVHLQTHSKEKSAAGKKQRAKGFVGLPTEVASYETVGQISATTQQTPQQTPQQEEQQQQYTTMANYQHATIVTPQTVGGEAMLQAKTIAGGLEAQHDSYGVQLAPDCIAKPIQAMWQNM